MTTSGKGIADYNVLDSVFSPGLCNNSSKLDTISVQTANYLEPQLKVQIRNGGASTKPSLSPPLPLHPIRHKGDPWS